MTPSENESLFAEYGTYYDLLYQDKDYHAECQYLDALLRRFGDKPSTLLELGCGSGKHAGLLADAGYAVTGVDQSSEMIARARSANGRHLNAGKCQFDHGDVRSVRFGRTFEAVLSLFHVISYQTSDADLRAMLKTAREHLAEKGLLVFDLWYGPAVLSLRPQVRVKRVENDLLHVTRIAEPELFPEENRVDVAYTIYLEDKRTGTIRRLTEIHPMRYFTTPEIRHWLESEGFELLHSEEWLTGRKPACETWGVCYVARKTS